MIWFACSKCNKRHSRPDSSAGTFVFCDCGQGNSVPWESTVEAAEAPLLPPAVSLPVEPLDEPASVPPSLPRFNAVPVGEERVPPRKAPAPIPFADDKPAQLPPRERDRGPRRRPGLRRRDPRFCLNHEDRPTDHPCADCGNGFCGDCLVTLKGQSLCGPCKNFRVRKIHGPQRASLYAIISVILAGVTAPIGFCLLPISDLSGNPLISILALLSQFIAVTLAALGLREVETDQRATGRGLAYTALSISVFVIFLTFFLTLFGSR